MEKRTLKNTRGLLGKYSRKETPERGPLYKVGLQTSLENVCLQPLAGREVHWAVFCSFQASRKNPRGFR